MARLPRIPDLLTTANLCCGVGSILLASQGQLTWACWLVFAGAVFDVFDGLAARALGGGSPLGAQLDSLADMVTFGVAPGMLVYRTPIVLQDPVQSLLSPYHTNPHPFGYFGLVAPLLVVVCSMWRLAKFNLDTRQSTGFLGLPTPANALLWAAITLSILDHAVLPGPASSALVDMLRGMYSSPWTSIVLAALLGALMLSELPLPSLKFKHFKWKGNEVIYLLLGIGALLVVLYGVLAVPLILLLYLLSPLWGKLFPKQPA